MSICQHIWDVLIRMQKTEESKKASLDIQLPIDIDIQKLGIISASSLWFNKISELRGGHDRQRFLEYLGRFMRIKLLDDKSMSYPGHNGFSLTCQDLLEYPDVEEFIQDMVDYGVLIEVEHTSKKRTDPPRKKWYPNPVYCPYLRIYEARIKEPYYAKIAEVIEWIKLTREAAGGFQHSKQSKEKKSKKSQTRLTDTRTLFD